MTERQKSGASWAKRIEIRALQRDDWKTVARLFGTNGACGGCWCMWWRVERGGKTWEEAKGEKNRARLARAVRAGDVHAVLALDGAEPVGWCSFGPRESFPRLANSRVLKRDSPAGTWCIVCFFLPARSRGAGIATRLLDAATERAFVLGARQLEGFPVAPMKSGEPVPAAFAWTGVPALFRKSGFKSLRRAPGLRPIWVRNA
jgi:GNAT superfamily N-acetyltransferase